MKKGINILIVLNILLTVIIYYQFNKKEKQIHLTQQTTIDSLQKVVDSLQHQSYVFEKTVDRYDIAIELMEEKYPKEYNKFNECFHNVE